MRLVAFASALPDGWLLVGQSDHFADGYLCFVPFEYQRAVWPQHPECFCEACADIVWPRLLIQSAILLFHPGIFADPI